MTPTDPFAVADQSEPDGHIRPCTCHRDDNPPVPCPRKYALTECRRSAEMDGLRVEVVRLTALVEELKDKNEGLRLDAAQWSREYSASEQRAESLQAESDKWKQHYKDQYKLSNDALRELEASEAKLATLSQLAGELAAIVGQLDSRDVESWAVYERWRAAFPQTKDKADTGEATHD